MSRGGYVWEDELDEESLRTATLVKSSAASVASAPPPTSSNKQDSSRLYTWAKGSYHFDISSNKDTESVNSNGKPETDTDTEIKDNMKIIVNNLQEKISNLKTNILSKTSQLKQLQQEIERLDDMIASAKQRKQQQQDSKLESQRQQNSKVLSEQQDILRKLNVMVADLSMKWNALKDREMHYHNSQNIVMDNFNRDCSRKLNRSRQQLQQAENQSFQVTLQSKHASYQHQITTSLAQQLDQRISHLRLTVRNRDCELNALFEKFKYDITVDLESELKKEAHTLRMEQQQALEQREIQHSELLERIKKNHINDVKLVHEKHERRMKEWEENNARRRTCESSGMLEKIKQLRELELQQLQQLRQEHQQHLQQLQRDQKDTLMVLKERGASEIDDLKKKLVQQSVQQEREQLEQSKASLQAQFASETETIIQQLHDENMNERNVVENRLNESINMLRGNNTSTTMALQQQLQELENTIESIHQTMGEYQQQQHDLQQQMRQIEHAATKDEELLQLLKQSRLTLASDVHVCQESLNASLVNVVDGKCLPMSPETVDTRENTEVEELEKELENLCQLSVAKTKQLQDQQKEEIERIQEKVKVLLSRRKQNMDQQQQQYEYLSATSTQMEEQLHQLRTSHVNS